MRLFIAVNIPDDVKEQVTHIQKRLRAVPVDVRWVEEEKFHLTLKFLGEVKDEKLPAVVAALAGAIQGSSPFEATLSGLGVFPGMRAPRVIWAGMQQGQEELRSLAEKVDAALSCLGFEREKRKFTGHLTLGRVRSLQNIEALTNKIVSFAATPIGTFAVRSVEVMQSILHPQGAQHQCLKSISM
jgi:2'-5' RNA ligase